MTEESLGPETGAARSGVDPGAVVRPRGGCRTDTEGTDDAADLLDTRMVPVPGVSGRVSALHVGWVQKRRFVPLVWPPSDEDHLGSWLHLVDFLEADLHWLLSRPYHCFWSQVVYDLQLADTLDITLQQLPRPHQLQQLPHGPVTRPRVVAIADLLLRVVLRMSTYKESRHDRMTPRLFARLVYDNYVWDVERMLDVCSVYGEGNCELLHRLLSTLFSQQPSYWRDLRAFAEALPAIFERLESEAKSAPLEAALAHSLDTVWALMSLLACYRPLARSLVAASLPSHLVRLYETVVVCLHERITVTESTSSARQEAGSVGVRQLRRKLFLIRCCILKTFRSMVEHHWLQGLMAGASCESTDAAETNNLDDFLNLLTDCLSEEIFVKDMNTVYPISLDLELIGSSCPEVDPERLAYIIDALKESGDSSPPAVEALNPQPSDHVENSVPEELPSAPSEVELQSMVSNVKDLLPDISDSFVVACLRYFGYRIEDVINALLEDSLPDELASLSRDAAESPPTLPPNSEVECPETESVCLRLPGGGKARGMEDLCREVQQMSSARDPALRQRYAELANLYEDDYDDTYDGLPAMIGNADASEPDAPVRPFERIRLNDALPSSKWNQRRYLEQEDEDCDESGTGSGRKTSHFVEDPAVVRQRRQEQYERKQAVRRGRGGHTASRRREGRDVRPAPAEEGTAREPAAPVPENGRKNGEGGDVDSRNMGSDRRNNRVPHSSRPDNAGSVNSADRSEEGFSRDVVGRAKGQGQTKEVLRNRRIKNAHKGSERRRGSDRKSRGGLFC